MTTRVVLEIPGDPNPQSLELDEGAGLVVGREPVPGDDARAVTVAVPSVSATHVSIRRDGGATTLVDARSRNGTWLRLPPGDRVVVESDQPVVLRLGTGIGAEPVDAGPADAAWTGREDFHLGVVRAISDWFERLRVPANVTALPRADHAVQELPGQMPLANGFDVSVVPLRTMDHRWERMAGVLWTYTAAQNLVFTTEEHTRGEGMVLVSPAIRRVHRTVVEAARRGVRVLFFGPSGSGKDGLARCYHRNSGRSGAFVAKNCSMFSREFLRVELFGAEKGAFTGAVRSIVGAVERAHDGTLFLDEIGELGPEVQAMLLTFLDHGEYERFGGNGMARTADVRIISSSNRDLRSATASHAFREDLWYRIAGQIIEVPALCDRPEDVQAYLQLARLPSGLSAHEALTPDARDRLLAYRWPGNFRELKSFVTQLPGAATPGSIDAADVEALLRRIALAPPQSAPSPSRPAATGAGVDIARLAGLAADAFQTDLAKGLTLWDDVKQYIESYLKPLLFAALTGAGAGRQDIAALAHAIEADRGTVRKHLARFLERFAGAKLDDP